MRNILLIAAILVVRLAIPTRAADWLQFRGTDRSGISAEAQAPLTWSAEKNVKWKVALPAGGEQQPDRLRRSRLSQLRAASAGIASKPVLLRSRGWQTALGEDDHLATARSAS